MPSPKLTKSIIKNKYCKQKYKDDIVDTPFVPTYIQAPWSQ